MPKFLPLTQTPAPSPPGVPQTPAPATPSLPRPAIADLQGLQAQLVDLRVQLQALRAQYSGLERVLNRMRLDNPARAGIQAQAADVGSNIAKVEGDIARVQAQIAERQGTPFPTTELPSNPLPRPARQFDPDLAAGLMFAFIFAVLMPMSIAMARRIWRGKPAAPRAAMDDANAQRLERLEHAIDAIAIEVERISEGQRFVTKVLAERPTQPASAPKSEMAAGEPLRALGAGPMEPIRIPEGQKLRQSITPH